MCITEDSYIERGDVGGSHLMAPPLGTLFFMQAPCRIPKFPMGQGLMTKKNPLNDLPLTMGECGVHVWLRAMLERVRLFGGEGKKRV